MSFEQIIKMLREFYYEKNGVRSTIEFINYISYALYEVDRQQMEEQIEKFKSMNFSGINKEILNGSIRTN